MPRTPPPGDAINVVGIVIAVIAAGGGFALTWNVAVGIAVMGVAALLTVVLVLWYIVGALNQRVDRKKAEAARIEALRPLAKALASLAEPREPTGPMGIYIKGGANATIKHGEFEGLEEAIHSEDHDGLTVEGVQISADPNQSRPRSHRRSRRD